MQYETPEVIEIGEAQEIILGSDKGVFMLDWWMPMADPSFMLDEMDE